MRSLFRRAGRYPPSPEIDPGENRLTEAFASVLERVDGLPALLVTDWTQAEAEGPVSIRTQRGTLGGRFIDLELAFGAGAVPDRRVWVEIKHGAGLHENQLENYVEDMELELQTSSSLVLLAPRATMPEQSNGATGIEWQQVARLVAGVARSMPHGSASRFLLEEFVLYLKEEGLADEEALSPSHAFVLSARPGTDRTVARLIEVAQHHVVKEWGAPHKTAKNYGTAWWASFDVVRSGSAAPTWRNGWFDWTLLEDEFRPEPHGGYAFFAGASFQSMKDSPLAVPGNNAWLASRTADGFERLQSWYWRVWRTLYPEQLMIETTLDAQARKLAEWVVESFQLLSENPPPE